MRVWVCAFARLFVYSRRRACVRACVRACACVCVCCWVCYACARVCAVFTWTAVLIVVLACHCTHLQTKEHSFWHDDPTTENMREKYRRRIARFNAIKAHDRGVSPSIDKSLHSKPGRMLWHMCACVPPPPSPDLHWRLGCVSTTGESGLFRAFANVCARSACMVEMWLKHDAVFFCLAFWRRQASPFPWRSPSSQPPVQLQLASSSYYGMNLYNACEFKTRNVGSIIGSRVEASFHFRGKFPPFGSSFDIMCFICRFLGSLLCSFRLLRISPVLSWSSLGFPGMPGGSSGRPRQLKKY